MVIPADSEVPSGWPLRLGNMNIRLRLLETSTATATYSSPSFSSLSSSNLDTESTASFFPDRSVSLGRLIGIRPPGNRGFPGKVQVEGNLQSDIDHRRSHSEGGKGEGEGEGEGVCVPLLQNVMGKMSRSKSSTKLRMGFQN
ncbi:PREDICTED: uncharacterized protein LOC109158839 [Ipomoea nil]|uniref:uncharacterized protein LOC109158839 n=1 Tax=Ipomoea nil TaxID=35883 RepID=UPI0009010A77|nr:PREDICTED: uncharacterized protein LOC109158839 [Ipomoea nil]